MVALPCLVSALASPTPCPVLHPLLRHRRPAPHCTTQRRMCPGRTRLLKSHEYHHYPCSSALHRSLPWPETDRQRFLWSSRTPNTCCSRTRAHRGRRNPMHTVQSQSCCRASRPSCCLCQAVTAFPCCSTAIPLPVHVLSLRSHYRSAWFITRGSRTPPSPNSRCLVACGGPWTHYLSLR